MMRSPPSLAEWETWAFIATGLQVYGTCVQGQRKCMPCDDFNTVNQEDLKLNTKDSQSLPNPRKQKMLKLSDKDFF